MAVAPPVPRLPYLPVSTPTAAAASIRRLGASGGRGLSGSLYPGVSASQASTSHAWQETYELVHECVRVHELVQLEKQCCSAQSHHFHFSVRATASVHLLVRPQD